MYKVKIDPRVTEQFPHYTLLVIYAEKLSNDEGDAVSTAILREAEEQQRKAFGDEKPANHPHIVAWREAYKNFGLKPSKYPCSVEALLSRTLKGNDLPLINKLVDLYNAVSIKHVIPVGGENWDKLTSDLTLTFATGQEPFDTMQEGQPVISHPETGEVVWLDSTGVTCRAWNWRQCFRTRLTEDTTNAYFILDRLATLPLDTLKAAGDELMEHIRRTSPNAVINYELHGSTSA